MLNVQIYDPALCCSSGVCGIEVNQQLLTFAADLSWLQQQGAHIERFNLAQQPLAFAKQPLIKDLLDRDGEAGLPAVLINGELVLGARYPSRSELAQWAGLAPAIAAGPSGCSGNGCC